MPPLLPSPTLEMQRHIPPTPSVGPHAGRGGSYASATEGEPIIPPPAFDTATKNGDIVPPKFPLAWFVGARNDSDDQDVGQRDIWSTYKRQAEEYDQAMVTAWNGSMDALLIFAALFSAVLTAFLLESYKDLKPDFTELMFRRLLDESFVEPDFRPSLTAQVVNCLWIGALICSLATSLFGIVAKQWLAAYMARDRDDSGALYWSQLRQFRFNGLIQWHLPEILAWMPVGLHGALLLFLAGLITLLVPIDRATGYLTLVLSAAVLGTYLLCLLLPIIWQNSPFRTQLTPGLQKLLILWRELSGQATIAKHDAWDVVQEHCSVQLTAAALSWLASRSNHESVYERVFAEISDHKDGVEVFDNLSPALQKQIVDVWQQRRAEVRTVCISSPLSPEQVDQYFRVVVTLDSMRVETEPNQARANTPRLFRDWYTIHATSSVPKMESLVVALWYLLEGRSVTTIQLHPGESFATLILRLSARPHTALSVLNFLKHQADQCGTTTEPMGLDSIILLYRSWRLYEQILPDQQPTLLADIFADALWRTRRKKLTDFKSSELDRYSSVTIPLFCLTERGHTLRQFLVKDLASACLANRVVAGDSNKVQEMVGKIVHAIQMASRYDKVLAFRSAIQVLHGWRAYFLQSIHAHPEGIANEHPLNLLPDLIEEMLPAGPRSRLVDAKTALKTSRRRCCSVITVIDFLIHCDTSIVRLWIDGTDDTGSTLRPDLIQDLFYACSQHCTTNKANCIVPILTRVLPPKVHAGSAPNASTTESQLLISRRKFSQSSTTSKKFECSRDLTAQMVFELLQDLDIATSAVAPAQSSALIAAMLSYDMMWFNVVPTDTSVKAQRHDALRTCSKTVIDLADSLLRNGTLYIADEMLLPLFSGGTVPILMAQVGNVVIPGIAGLLIKTTQVAFQQLLPQFFEYSSIGSDQNWKLIDYCATLDESFFEGDSTWLEILLEKLLPLQRRDQSEHGVWQQNWQDLIDALYVSIGRSGSRMKPADMTRTLGVVERFCTQSAIKPGPRAEHPTSWEDVTWSMKWSQRRTLTLGSLFNLSNETSPDAFWRIPYLAWTPPQVSNILRSIDFSIGNALLHAKFLAHLMHPSAQWYRGVPATQATSDALYGWVLAALDILDPDASLHPVRDLSTLQQIVMVLISDANLFPLTTPAYLTAAAPSGEYIGDEADRRRSCLWQLVLQITEIIEALDPAKVNVVEILSLLSSSAAATQDGTGPSMQRMWKLSAAVGPQSLPPDFLPVLGPDRSIVFVPEHESGYLLGAFMNLRRLAPDLPCWQEIATDWRAHTNEDPLNALTPEESCEHFWDRVEEEYRLRRPARHSCATHSSPISHATPPVPRHSFASQRVLHGRPQTWAPIIQPLSDNHRAIYTRLTHSPGGLSHRGISPAEFSVTPRGIFLPVIHSTPEELSDAESENLPRARRRSTHRRPPSSPLSIGRFEGSPRPLGTLRRHSAQGSEVASMPGRPFDGTSRATIHQYSLNAVTPALPTIVDADESRNASHFALLPLHSSADSGVVKPALVPPGSNPSADTGAEGMADGHAAGARSLENGTLDEARHGDTSSYRKL